MPREVTAAAVEEWLAALGRCFRYPARLYLVGGTSLLLARAKVATLDVDVQFKVDPAHHTEWVRCVRQVSQQMGVSVEQVSPADFIPLPSGYEQRHRYVERFGQLDVFHFDFYSVALSKLHRGNEKDYADVISMVRRQLISVGRLREYFREILVEVEKHDISASPEDYARRFALFLDRLDSANSVDASN